MFHSLHTRVPANLKLVLLGSMDRYPYVHTLLTYIISNPPNHLSWSILFSLFYTREDEAPSAECLSWAAPLPTASWPQGWGFLRCMAGTPELHP